MTNTTPIGKSAEALPEPLGYISPGDIEHIQSRTEQYRGRNYNIKATVFLDYGTAQGSATEGVYTAEQVRAILADRTAQEAAPAQSVGEDEIDGQELHEILASMAESVLHNNGEYLQNRAKLISFVRRIAARPSAAPSVSNDHDALRDQWLAVDKEIGGKSMHALAFDDGVSVATLSAAQVAVPTESQFLQVVGMTPEQVERALSERATPSQAEPERCCLHDSDCAVHNAPALPVGPCDCSQAEPASQGGADMVPLSKDGTHVWIDGAGAVELKYPTAVTAPDDIKTLFMDWWLSDMSNAEFFNRAAPILGVTNADMDRPVPNGYGPAVTAPDMSAREELTPLSELMKLDLTDMHTKLVERMDYWMCRALRSQPKGEAQ